MILPGRGAGWVCRMFSDQSRRGSVDVNLGEDIGYGKKDILWGIIKRREVPKRDLLGVTTASWEGAERMSRFLIELTHEDEHTACLKALRAIERYGAHLLTAMDWGCKVGTHSGWLIAEVDNRDEAARLVPPEFRKEARIVELNKFTREEIASLSAEESP